MISRSLGAGLDLEGNQEDYVTARLIFDCMGNSSQISRQQHYGKIVMVFSA